MKTSLFFRRCIPCLLAMFLLALSARAQQVQLLTTNALTAPSATGGGDSSGTIISRDGRYVLFSSTANNLATNTAGAPFAPMFPAKLNVFIRDRTNGTTTLVSINTNANGGGNGDSFAIGISTNGRFAMFESAASNLAVNDNNNVNDIFVRDLLNGTTTLVSVNTSGASATGPSRSSTMTPDGRYVAFVSSAADLVSGDTNGIDDVFVRDLTTGTTTLVSVGAMNPSSASSESPDISANGRYVAFYSTATNLIAGITTSGEVYVRDLFAATTTLASVNAHTVNQSVFGTNYAVSYNQTMSDDGQFVVFQSSPRTPSVPVRPGVILRYSLLTGLTDTINTNAIGSSSGSEANYRSLDISRDGRFVTFVTNVTASTSRNAIMVWDAQSNTTTLASGDINNNIPTVSDCYWPQISDNGRYVSFFSSANLTSNLVISGYHLYVRDMQLNVTALADIRTDGSAPSYSPPNAATLSSNGLFIAFESYDPNLTANDANRGYDVFVRNLAANTTELISVRQPTLPSLSLDSTSALISSSVSTNGRYLAFYSDADGLAANDTNIFRDVYVHDLLTGSNTLVSVASDGTSANGPSGECVISGDGRYVAFSSTASNLVTGDNNIALDVFRRDLLTGTTLLVSSNTTGTAPGNAPSYTPMISTDGRYILYRSPATTLTSGISASNENIFRCDTLLKQTFAFTTNTSSTLKYVTSMTPDGRYVAVGGAGVTFYVWDMQVPKRVYTNAAAITNVVLSADGKHVGYFSAGQAYFLDLNANTNQLLGTAGTGSHALLQFSADGRFLTYAIGGSGKTNQVYLFDSQTGTNLLVSKSYLNSGGGNSNSDSQTISSDGHYIAYRSAATDLVPNDLNGQPDIFLYDRISGATTLVSLSQFGNFSGNSRSLTPVFSADAHTLFFDSWSSDLVSQDFNQGGDLFAITVNNSISEAPFPIGIVPPATVSWAVVPGKNYQVQFKNNLTDANWQILNGSVTLIGTQGYATDLSPSPTRKFYRVVAF